MPIPVELINGSSSVFKVTLLQQLAPATVDGHIHQRLFDRTHVTVLVEIHLSHLIYRHACHAQWPRTEPYYSKIILSVICLQCELRIGHYINDKIAQDTCSNEHGVCPVPSL